MKVPNSLWIVPLTCLALSCGASEPLAPTRPPNIVLIVSDDHAFGDFGFMGSQYARTPHLDELAQAGTVFSHGYTTASTCRPSMRSLLTGLETIQWWGKVFQLTKSGVRRGFAEQVQDFETLPRRLAEVGYRSFQAGKFWEANFAIAGFTHGMQADGENTFWGSEDAETFARPSIEPVLNFIDQFGDEPFFLWFAPKLPHVPHDAPLSRANSFPATLSGSARRYYANVERLDNKVGELMAHLKARGIWDDTLVVFVTDNGWDQAPDYQRHAFTVHDGDRGKGTVYEVGFRTPIIFSWPGQIPSGVVDSRLVSIVDLFPTLLDYGNAMPSDDRPGFNLRPILEGGSGPSRENLVGWVRSPRSKFQTQIASPSAFTLRQGSWRYIWFPRTDHQELYDLGQDPEQRKDVSEDHADRISDFRAVIEEWQTEMTQRFGEPGKIVTERRERRRIERERAEKTAS